MGEHHGVGGLEALTKKCTRCKVEKKLSDFALNNRAKDGRHSRCKPCIADVARERRDADRESYNEYQRTYRATRAAEGAARERDYAQEYKTLRRYGLTRSEYEEVVKNPCGICGDFYEGDMQLDHCHVTGKVRGSLCRACNTGLGLFRDDPARLASAIDYLKKHANE